MLRGNRATLRGALTAAVLTGVFCAAFASVMHQVAPMVTLVAVIVLSAVSGFSRQPVREFRDEGARGQMRRNGPAAGAPWRKAGGGS